MDHKSKSFTQRRVETLQKQLQGDRQIIKFKYFLRDLAALVFTRAYILGPIERMKIILQVKHLAQFVNAADRPKNLLDLSGKIGVNQGFVAYFRGVNALIYKLVLCQGLKFMLYEAWFQAFSEKSLTSSIMASTASALTVTALAYPLDLAHGRMAADMSKKPTIAQDKASTLAKKKVKLYSSVRDCLTKAQEQSGVTKNKKVWNVYRGLPTALMSQVPYTATMIAVFEHLHAVADSQQTKFNAKKDDVPFIHKYAVRFGPSTAALILAQTLCYSFDTVKRRMQLNGSIGHKNLYRNDIHCFQTMWREEGVRAFYGGFTANMARCVPQVMIQYIMFQAFRFMTRVKSEQRARE